MNCPTTETLEQLALGFLQDEASVRAHAGGCAECARRLETLGRDHAVLAGAARDVLLPDLRKPRAWKPWAAAAAAVVGVGLAALAWPREESFDIDYSVRRVRAGTSEAPDRDLLTRAERSVEALEKSIVPPSAPMAAPPPPPPVVEPDLAIVPRSAPVPDPASSPEPAPMAVAPPSPPEPLEGEFLPRKGETVDRPFRGKETIEPSAPAPAPALAKRSSATMKRVAPGAPSVAGGRFVEDEPPPPADMTFQDPGIHRRIDAATKTTSTFSMDVDTASYTVMRNYLSRGQLPPMESVRVEEYVNYFKYPDAPPVRGTFGIGLEAAPSPFDPSRHLLRVALQGKKIAESERKDVTLTFVIDVSGSMAQENRLGLVKQSLRILLERLRGRDRVGIVVFGTTARLLLDPIPVSRRARILEVIDSLHTEGSTNLDAGLNLGYSLAERFLDGEATNRVILCTDGVANNGVTNPDEMLIRIRRQREKGILLSALGFGMGNMNDALLEKLADHGNGHYAYIDDLEEARKLFVEKLTGLLEVIALDAKIQVEFNPEAVATWRLLGYENRRLANRDFRNDKIDAGEVGAGHQVTALYEITLKEEAVGRLATTRIRYREPGSKEVVETQATLGCAQVLGSASEATPSYRLAASVAQFAEILRENPYAKGVTLAQVAEEARRLARELELSEDAAEFARLVRAAMAIRR